MSTIYLIQHHCHITSRIISPPEAFQVRVQFASDARASDAKPAADSPQITRTVRTKIDWSTSLSNHGTPRASMHRVLPSALRHDRSMPVGVGPRWPSHSPYFSRSRAPVRQPSRARYRKGNHVQHGYTPHHDSTLNSR